MRKPSSLLTATFAFGLSINFLGGLSLAAEPLPVMAPLNPEFSAAGTTTVPARLFAVTGEEEHPTGFVPGPVDYSYLKGQQIGPEATGAFAPARYSLSPSYDLRTQGKLTAVRDQGSCGSCWAFAAMGSVESMLKPEEDSDFSENNLKNKHGFDWGHCDGGNGDMSIAYLSRLDGPVNETDDPYNDTSNVSPSGLNVQKILTKAVIIPPRTGPLDNDAIKQAILDYGAVQSSYYSSTSPSYYRAATFSYYYNGSATSNHAIDLVGWDDNYQKSNFATIPADNGAFIVRNSWGSGWGESGYFYLSYYDTKIGNDNYQFRSIEPVTSVANIYQYDPLGKTSSMGSGTSTTYWGANIFTAAGTESITSFGLHAASAGSTCDWYIYTGVTAGVPRSGTLAASGTGLSLAAPGYHVVPVTPVAVTGGQRFSIVIRLTTPGYNYPIPIEKPITSPESYSSQATASAGQSYFSSNGSSWGDVTTPYPNTNISFKALSQYSVTAGVTGGNGAIISTNPAYTGNNGSATFTLTPDPGYMLSSTVTGTCASGSFTGNSYTTGTISGNCTVSFSFVSAPTHVLTLSMDGVSGGSISVTPSPPGDICPGNCSQSITEGEVVTLTPAHGAGGQFSSWSGDCSGSGACQITMDGPKIVTATFVWGQNVKDSASGNVYGLISPLYDLLTGGETVMVRGIDLTENLNFNRSISITLKGGYDVGFLTASAYSTINGSLTITDGSVTVENIAIR